MSASRSPSISSTTSSSRFSIVVVGDGAVGKSAMTLRFLRDQFHDEYDPTIEDSYCKHIEVDGVDYTLDIIDTAGQHEYRGHWNDQFLRSGDGFICVYSIASMGSFQELVGFRDQIWRAKESEYVPIVIAANKTDLGDEREVALEVGEEFAQLSNAYFIETSAKTGFNVHEMVHELVRKIVRTRQQGDYVDIGMMHGISSNSGSVNGGPMLTTVAETGGTGPAVVGTTNTKNASTTTMTTMGYVKSPTPMGLIDEDDLEPKEDQCCCTIM
ncbi:Ras GTPase [Haplosporangium sp. Z 27]|nr:Ras GTPase [Haplosporangium sp. Z 27]